MSHLRRAFYLLISLFFLVWVFTVSLRLIIHFDYWTHLARGRELFALGTDFFLNPQLLFSGAYTTWPFQSLVYAVEKSFSHEGVSILIAVIAAAIFLPLLRRGVCAHNPFGSFLFILALLGIVISSRFRFIPRPEILSYLLFSSAMALACRWTEKPSFKNLLAIVVLLALWKPLHPTLYIGGPLIIATIGLIPQKPGFWRTQFRQPPFLFLLVPVAGVLLFYSGGFAHYVFSLLEKGKVLSGVVEMMPSWHFPSLFWPFVLTSLLALFLSLQVRQGRYQRLSLIFIALAPGLAAIRNIPISLIFIAFMAAEGVRQNVPTVSRSRKSLIASTILIIALLLGGRELTMVDPPFGTGVQWDWFPQKSAQFVANQQLPSPLFNNWDWGGYLLWSLNERPKPFLDGRFLGNKEKLEDYDRIFAGNNYEQLLKKYDIKTILIRPLYLDSARVFPLVTRLLYSQNWTLVDAQDALVFVRKDQTEGLTSRPRSEAWNLIIRQADALEKNDPRFEHPHLDFTRGLAYMSLGEYSKAQGAFQKGQAEFPETATQYSH